MPDILNMVHMTKQFGNFKANDDISIDVRKRGRSWRFWGKTAPAKATLDECALRPVSPHQWVKSGLTGSVWTLKALCRRFRLGIGMVHQHFMLVQAFKIWENMVLGLQDEQEHVLKEEQPPKRRFGSWPKKYRLQIDPDARIARCQWDCSSRWRLQRCSTGDRSC